MIARLILQSSYISGYETSKFTIDTPTYTFLQNMKMFRLFMDLKHSVNNADYSLNTRFLYGLPVKYSELEYVLKKTMKRAK